MPPATMPQVPVAMSITPEMANLEQQLQGIANVSPAAINMAAKQYFAPIVNPLIREGGQRLQEYVGGLQGMLNVPTGETQASYTTGINNAIANMARTGGQYDANLGLRDYYGTRAENLGNLGLQTLQYQQQAKKNLYDQIQQRLLQTNQNRFQNYLAGFDQLKYGADQAQIARDEAWRQKQADEQARQFAISQANRGGGGAGSLPFDMNNPFMQYLATTLGFGNGTPKPSVPNPFTTAPNQRYTIGGNVVGGTGTNSSYQIKPGRTIVGTNMDGTPMYN